MLGRWSEGGARGFGLISRTLGTPRVAVRFHYGRPPSLAGRERRKGGESRLDQGCDHFPSAAGRTAPGCEIAAMERWEARHPRQDAHASLQKVRASGLCAA